MSEPLLMTVRRGAVGFFVAGEPGPKGSFNVYPSKKGGRGNGRESSKRAKPWMQAVASTIGACDYEPLEPPYGVQIVYFVHRPAKPKFPWPGSIKVGDLDKLDRCTHDGLKLSGLIVDDAHIIETGPNRKLYVAPGQVMGATIQVWTADYPTV